MDFADTLSTSAPASMELTATIPGVSVGVVGGGLAGLACAARLARAGLRVTLYERNVRPGGKMNQRREAGYTWDTGPSLLTMPEVLAELWQDLGDPPAEGELEVQRLECSCQYHWQDGTVIRQDAAFWQRPEVARLVQHAEGIYALSAQTFLHSPLDEWAGALNLRTILNLRHLPKIASRKSLAQVVRRHVRDPHLVQIFERYATYNGSSPYDTPAAFAIIPYVEAHYGAWYVRGGLYEIVEKLVRRAENLGVIFKLDTTVTGICQDPDPGANGGAPGACMELTFQEGELPPSHAHHHYIVCNQDVLSAAEEILAPPLCQGLPRTQPPERDLSLSGLVLLLAVERQYPQLDQHNIFFSADYRAEFAELFEQGRLPRDPTIYVNISARTDPSQAPPGCENWFVLVNAPNLRAGCAVEEDWEARAEEIIARLETHWGLTGLRAAVVQRELITPADFHSRYRAFGGGLYGFASHGIFSAFQRPPMTAPTCDRLYFTGGTTHPGGGIPLVLLSAKMVAGKILRHEKRA